MEKINLNLSVSVDVAIKILAVIKENEEPEWEEICTDTPSKDINPAPVEVPKVEPIRKPEAPSVTLDDVRHAFVELSQSKGKDMAKQVIAGLGFKRVTEIPEIMFSVALTKVKGEINC